MFNIGDLIFYSKTGVCEVLEITEIESSAFSEPKLYYLLKPLYQDCNISIPVDNDKVYMRPILSKEMVHELIDEIPHIEVKAYYSQNLNQLKNHYKEIMDSHSSKAMIELTLSVNKKRQEAEENKQPLLQPVSVAFATVALRGLRVLLLPFLPVYVLRQLPESSTPRSYY